jgi:hypothetical protein
VRIFLEHERDRVLISNLTATVHNRIDVSSMTDMSLTKHDRMYVIFNPDNVMSNRLDLLEDVQAICFHGALKKIPVLMINPSLIATAWNDFGPRPPLLLADFAQAYFACDDLFMMSHKEDWIGIVQRASSGIDLFRLTGFVYGSKAPKKFSRIESWSDGMPDNLRSVLATHLAKEPFFNIGIFKNNKASISRQ